MWPDYKGVRKQIRKETRERNDMPRRGNAKAKHTAITAGSQLPADHVAVWRCVQGHPFFTVGPIIAYNGLLLIQAGTSATTLMYGSHGVRRVVCGACAFSWSEQLPLKRDVQQALRAVWRLDGERGVQATLTEHYGYPNLVGLPFFRLADGDEVGRNFPETSMQSALLQSSRYVRGGSPW